MIAAGSSTSLALIHSINVFESLAQVRRCHHPHHVDTETAWARWAPQRCTHGCTSEQLGSIGAACSSRVPPLTQPGGSSWAGAAGTPAKHIAGVGCRGVVSLPQRGYVPSPTTDVHAQGFLYHLSALLRWGSSSPHTAAGRQGSRQPAPACSCPQVGIAGFFPMPIGAGGGGLSEHSRVCGCLGGIQLLAEGPRWAWGQVHPQVNPHGGSGALPGARLPQGCLGSLAGVHLLPFLPR